jgi:hypothetical protein
MNKLFLSFASIFFVSFTFCQTAVIVPAGSSQSDFLKAFKAVLAISDKGYHETDADPSLFAAYGEHSVYWVTSGDNKGSFIIPVTLPDAFSSVSRNTLASYDWKSSQHRSVQFNAQTDRIAVFRSTIQANDNSITWEAVYFRNLFDTYLFPDAIQIVDEQQLMEKGLSDSVKIFIVPSCNFKGTDGKYYIDQIIQHFPSLKEKIDPFLLKGGMIYAEETAFSLEKMGYFADSAVDFSDAMNIMPRTDSICFGSLILQVSTLKMQPVNCIQVRF